jgi:hypothetical protein
MGAWYVLYGTSFAPSLYSFLHIERTKTCFFPTYKNKANCGNSEQRYDQLLHISTVIYTLLVEQYTCSVKKLYTHMTVKLITSSIILTNSSSYESSVKAFLHSRCIKNVDSAVFILYPTFLLSVQTTCSLGCTRLYCLQAQCTWNHSECLTTWNFN